MNWSVEKGENFTYHNDLTFTLETEKVIIEKKLRNVRMQIGSSLHVHLKNPIRSLTNEKRLDMVNKLCSALNLALDMACPKTKQKVVDKSNPWWTDKHHEARKQLSKLYRKKQRKPNETNITAYKKNKKTEYA